MSVSCYLRMPCPAEEAMARYGRWIERPELAPPRLVAERDSIDLALADGDWLGLAVFVYASGPWTVFEEALGWAGRTVCGEMAGAGAGWRPRVCRLQ
jgi:hypothetical protein